VFQDPLLVAADACLYGGALAFAFRGKREQVHPPVGRVRVPADQPLLLKFVEHGDDPALVRADGLRERRLGAHRLLGQRVQHHVAPHRDVVGGQDRFLGPHKRSGQWPHHGRQIASAVRGSSHHVAG
jgi:hypothetical protein